MSLRLASRNNAEGPFNKGNDSIGKGKVEEELVHATLDDLIEEEDMGESEEHRLEEPLMRVDVNIGELIYTKAVIDTGATMTCISLEMCDRLRETNTLEGELPVSAVNLITALRNRKVRVQRQVMFNLVIEDRKYMTLAFVVKDLFVPVLLGLNWLKDNQVMINCRDWTLSIGESKEIHMGGEKEICKEENLKATLNDSGKLLFVSGLKEMRTRLVTASVGMIMWNNNSFKCDRNDHIINARDDRGSRKLGLPMNIWKSRKVKWKEKEDMSIV